MKLSVVVATHNRRALLGRVVGAILAQSLAADQYELILVDDGSADGTEKLGAELAQHRNVRYIRQENRGPAAARNRGIREAAGQIVAFTDDDCLVPPDWLARLADGYVRHPEVCGVGGGIVPTAEALESSALARYEKKVTRDVFGAADDEVLGGFECPAFGTNNMSYRRATLLEVDGFDEGFPPRVWGEDADLKLRITQRGGRLLYLPMAVVHLRDYRLKTFLRQSYQRGRGEAHFRLKHEGRRQWLSQVRRIAAATIRLLAAPLRRDPRVHAAAASDEMLKAAGCLLYRRGKPKTP